MEAKKERSGRLRRLLEASDLLTNMSQYPKLFEGTTEGDEAVCVVSEFVEFEIAQLDAGDDVSDDVHELAAELQGSVDQLVEENKKLERKVKSLQKVIDAKSPSLAKSPAGGRKKTAAGKGIRSAKNARKNVAGSGYKGVYANKKSKTKPFFAAVCVDNKQKHLGLFEFAIDGAIARAEYLEDPAEVRRLKAEKIKAGPRPASNDRIKNAHNRVKAKHAPRKVPENILECHSCGFKPTIDDECGEHDECPECSDGMLVKV